MIIKSYLLESFQNQKDIKKFKGVNLDQLMKEEIRGEETKEKENIKKLEYSVNLCVLLNLKKKKLINEKEFNILKEKIKNF